jgi:hypothetical protein
MQLATFWVRAGDNCAILVPEEGRQPYFPLDAEIRCTTSRGIPASVRGLSSKLPGLVLLFKCLREINNQFDIVLANHSLKSWAVW